MACDNPEASLWAAGELFPLLGVGGGGLWGCFLCPGAQWVSTSPRIPAWVPSPHPEVTACSLIDKLA